MIGNQELHFKPLKFQHMHSFLVNTLTLLECVARNSDDVSRKVVQELGEKPTFQKRIKGLYPAFHYGGCSLCSRTRTWPKFKICRCRFNYCKWKCCSSSFILNTKNKVTRIELTRIPPDFQVPSTIMRMLTYDTVAGTRKQTFHTFMLFLVVNWAENSLQGLPCQHFNANKFAEGRGIRFLGRSNKSGQGKKIPSNTLISPI